MWCVPVGVDQIWVDRDSRAWWQSGGLRVQRECGPYSSGGGVGLGLSGEQQYPATSELTAWQERPADSSQQSAEQACKRHMISHVMHLWAVEYPA